MKKSGEAVGRIFCERIWCGRGVGGREKDVVALKSIFFERSEYGRAEGSVWNRQCSFAAGERILGAGMRGNQAGSVLCV